MGSHPAPGTPNDVGPRAVTCDHCGEGIGRYEPLIVAEHGICRETSRADDEANLPGVDTTHYHRACYLSL